MARTTCSFRYEMWFQIKFKTAIRGHHVYKETWTPVLGEVLSCEKDDRAEASEYDSNAVGVYTSVKSANGADARLVGHVPIQLSRLIATFLKASQENTVSVEVCGKRKRELGLIVPGIYLCRTKSKACARILQEELTRIRDKYTHFEFEYEQSLLYESPYIIKSECK